MRRDIEVLRHPTLGVALPWMDTRPVPSSTMCEYLGCDYDRLSSLARQGCFSEKGCIQEVGDKRPITYYIPARIWAANGWMPSAAALAAMSGRPPIEGLRALAEQLGQVQEALTGLVGHAGVAPHIAGAAS